MLAVRPGISHSIVGGEGLIEHFGFRAPAAIDRHVVVGAPSAPDNLVGEIPRELSMPWGFRISLKEAQNFNCWLIGLGEARYQSANFLFAFLDFPTHEEANAGIGSRLRLHFHARSWEYYVCLKGSMTLQIEDEQVELHPGYMVEVYPKAKHNVIAREAPYVGMTFRVPLLADKVEY
jgi:mannose-6-phosphate isomerase-like protein (cupin superfamily)